jgi:mRNA-degrading endonuclease RelE of RelBE toxin-antitoxin system
MVDVKFEAVPEFKKELKKLSKKYKLLNEDFEKIRTVLTKKLPNHTPGTFEISDLGANVKTPIYKVKHFRSRDFRGKGCRSGFRIIYAHMQNSEKIIFIEIYHKNNKTNHDEKRIKEYFEDI